ncbi:MAG: hypothetical protein MMC33_002632 [Icmadophila ericetorum]|nr:hypothetical protein [Icmadophila ericetorum]
MFGPKLLIYFKAALQERLIQAEDRLQANGSFRDPHENPLTRELESRLQQQEDLIASQESQLSDYQTSTQALQNTVENLRKSHEKSQNLRDELDEVKAERDNLARKANTVDKYRQKLQASQNLEKENQLLRGELEELRQASTESSQAKQQIIQLELAVDEYRRILPKIEQDRHELQMMKKQLEFDNAAFARKYEAINEQHARDQEMIADLMDKTQGLDSPRTPGAKIGTGLDEELQDGIKARDQVDLDLRAENQDLLQVTNEATTKNLLLQQRIDDITAKHEAFEKKYFETYEENLALTSSLADLEKGSPMESTQVFQKMREQVKAEQKRRADLEAELANLKQQPVSNEARKEDQQRLSEQVSHISLLEAELQALRAQLSQPTEPIDETLIQQVNTALQLENAHLHTELKLMSSAWFDLANRLQMDDCYYILVFLCGSVVKRQHDGGDGNYSSHNSRNCHISSQLADKSMQSQREFYLHPLQPQKIESPSGGFPTQTANTSLVQLGFTVGLNFAFVASNNTDLTQIFEFLPVAIAYGLTIPLDQVTMQSLQPFNTIESLGYVVTTAFLQPRTLSFTAILTPQSTLVSLVNPEVPTRSGATINFNTLIPTGSPSSTILIPTISSSSAIQTTPGQAAKRDIAIVIPIMPFALIFIVRLLLWRKRRTRQSAYRKAAGTELKNSEMMPEVSGNPISFELRAGENRHELVTREREQELQGDWDRHELEAVEHAQELDMRS